MNFEQIIKEEWEKEFSEQEDLCSYEGSIFDIYEELVNKICIRVWNSAIELVAEEADVEDYYGTNVPDRNSILKLKIDGKTNTTEV